MYNGYIVRFICKDEKLNEEYFCHSYSDAINYLGLFKEDASAIYKRIEVIDSHSLRLPYAVLDFQCLNGST